MNSTEQLKVKKLMNLYKENSAPLYTRNTYSDDERNSGAYNSYCNYAKKAKGNKLKSVSVDLLGYLVATLLGFVVGGILGFAMHSLASLIGL